MSSCSRCTAIFTTKQRLVIHIRQHDDPTRKFACGVCGALRPSEAQLQRHFQNVHDAFASKPFKCNECSNAYKSIDLLQKHEKLRHPKLLLDSLKCPFCATTFGLSGKSSLTRHINAAHPGKQRFEWNTCRLSFKQEFRLKTHNVMHSLERSFVCGLRQVPARFKTKATLEHHHRSKHSQANKPFACPKCPATFRQSSELKTHTVIHSEARPFACSDCSKALKRREGLKIHRLNVHTPNYLKRFQCAKCPIGFHSSIHMKEHMLAAHSSGKAFSCQECDAGFKSPDELRQHIKRLHSKPNKPVRCPECPSTFIRQSNLRLHHRKIHQADRSQAFFCAGCGKSLRDPQGLMTHMRRHIVNPEARFACRRCPKSFRFPASLRSHYRKKHKAIKPYKCAKCGKPSNTKKDLIGHMLNKHIYGPGVQCSRCKKRCKSRNHLVWHLERAHRTDAVAIKCNDCSATFSFHYYLSIHRNAAHPRHCVSDRRSRESMGRFRR